MALVYIDDFEVTVANSTQVSPSTFHHVELQSADINRVIDALWATTNQPSGADLYHGHMVPLVLDQAGTLTPIFCYVEWISGGWKLRWSTNTSENILISTGDALRCSPQQAASSAKFVMDDSTSSTIHPAHGVVTRRIGPTSSGISIEFPSLNAVIPTTKTEDYDTDPAILEIYNTNAAVVPVTFQSGLIVSWLGGVTKTSISATDKVAIYTFQLVPIDRRTTLGAHVLAKAEFYE